MTRLSYRHDPERFYHCDCLDEDPCAAHDDRFYHCDCLSGGYTPPEDEAALGEP